MELKRQPKPSNITMVRSSSHKHLKAERDQSDMDHDDMNGDKKSLDKTVTPTAKAGAAAVPKSPSTGRLNCLCSPTTHAGSFRCRLHRNGKMPRVSSLGSSLSSMASKSDPLSDSLRAQ